MSTSKIIQKAKTKVALKNGFDKDLFGSPWNDAMMLTHRTKKQLDLYEEVLEEITSDDNKANLISWMAVENGLPDELETVWMSNGKGWTTLGCIVYAEGGWHWAETNGVIYQENGKIVSECESDDLDVKFWHRLPEPPCLELVEGALEKITDDGNRCPYCGSDRINFTTFSRMKCYECTMKWTPMKSS